MVNARQNQCRVGPQQCARDQQGFARLFRQPLGDGESMGLDAFIRENGAHKTRLPGLGGGEAPAHGQQFKSAKMPYRHRSEQA